MNAFYLQPDLWNVNPVLAGQEAQHAHVLRLKAGDKALLLDGEGRVGECVIVKAGKREFNLEITSEKFYEPPKAKAIMAIALGKGARRGFFLEKASELGAWEIWFWTARRSPGEVDAQILEAARGKLISGCKQSLNPWLPKLASFANINQLVDASLDCDWKYAPWEEELQGDMLLPLELGREGKTVYVIGPEGGISLEEMDALKTGGFKPVSLGNRVLRCETAAALCLGLHWWGSQLPGHADGKVCK